MIINHRAWDNDEMKFSSKFFEAISFEGIRVTNLMNHEEILCVADTEKGTSIMVHPFLLQILSDNFVETELNDFPFTKRNLVTETYG